MITPPDVFYSNPGHDTLYGGYDAHRCSSIVLESYITFFDSGDNALCVVPDAQHYSVVVVPGQSHCFPSGRNELQSVPDAHRCSAVQCCRGVDLTQKNAVHAACSFKPQGRSHEGSRSARRVEIKDKNLSEMTYNALNVSCKGWR